jgi:hypothetical protein
VGETRAGATVGRAAEDADRAADRRGGLERHPRRAGLAAL